MFKLNFFNNKPSLKNVAIFNSLLQNQKNNHNNKKEENC